jgi:2-desacetyl-2-hydroxyethyl bacteriochlorophyllide A dehydrogenase
MTRAQQLWFTAPQQVEVRDVELPALQARQVLVATEYSAISAGTELLVYRGQVPSDMSVDTTIASLQQQNQFPLRYGYACVGRVMAVGGGVEQSWLQQRVFAFQPHASHFIANPDELLQIPEAIDTRAALLLPNMETAVNLVHDGKPLFGENVVVLGQGIVGLLLTTLLARHPLQKLHVLDSFSTRRQLAQQLGATHSYDPFNAAEMAALQQTLSTHNGADLLYEVSGAPATLNTAITLSAYNSRIVIGSWYGNKSAPIHLGGAAHRNRLQLITSQVSTISPELSGRWSKQRRFAAAWDALQQIQAQRLITHTLPLSEAPTLYQRLAAGDEEIVQAVFSYSSH